MRFSVIVPAHDAADHIGGCVAAISAQKPKPSEIIVVDDGSSDSTAQIAEAAGARVLRLEESRGPGGARNAGAGLATEDVIAFTDADDVVQPGWLAGLEEAFERGAVAATTRIELTDVRTIPQGFARQIGLGSNEVVLAVGGQLAIRRDTFHQVGGYDELLLCGEDIDLSLRLILVLGRIDLVPGSVVHRRERSTIMAMLRQKARWAYWDPVLQWKWQNHSTVLGRMRIRQSPAFIAAQAVVGCIQGRPRDAAYSVVALMSEITWRGGRLAGTGALYLGHRRPPRPMPSPRSRDELTPPLIADPVAIVIGRDRRVVRLLARAMRAGTPLASPAPGLFEVRPWDQAPMWSRGLVRTARGMGWRLPPDIAARRVEWQQPSTHGEAVLALYRTFTWLHSKRGFVVASWDEGTIDALIRRFPNAKILSTDESAVTDLRIDIDEVCRSPQVVARRLSEILDLDDEPSLAGGLRLATLTPWMR